MQGDSSCLDMPAQRRGATDMSIRDSARIAALEAQMSELTARVEALEAQRRPEGRRSNADRVISTKTRKGNR